MGPAHYTVSKRLTVHGFPKREERREKQYYNIHAKHMYYYMLCLGNGDIQDGDTAKYAAF